MAALSRLAGAGIRAISPGEVYYVLGALVVGYDPEPCELTGGDCHHGYPPLDPDRGPYCPVGAALDMITVHRAQRARRL